MDKKQLLSLSLAKIMIGHKDALKKLVREHPHPRTTLKADGTPVTELDLALSSFIEQIVLTHYPGVTFYSEENFNQWIFPLIALDPLDGTREYIEGRNEWAISIGVFQNEDFKGEGWIYNPQTEECYSEAKPLRFIEKSSYLGEVSRSEWSSGLFKKRVSDKFSLKEMGSIAYKLGRLSQGKCDFVLSLRPKNIWDIAGGTLLTNQAGLKFYSEGKEVTKVQKEYRPPLIWCHEEIFLELSKTYL